MAVQAVAGLLELGRWEVRALLHPGNVKNWQAWSVLAQKFGPARFRQEPSATRSTRFEALKARWPSRAREQLRRQIQAFAPDLLLVVQGNIEQCSAVFHLQGELDCPLLSYIPLPHTHRQMGAKLGGLRDLSCRGLYSKPDGFITLSPTLGQMLQDAGARGPVQIVANGISLAGLQTAPSAAQARQQLGLPQTGFIWGQVGRTEFKQKGQDFALRTFLARAPDYPDEHLVFLGSGPDEPRLQQMARGAPRVHCLPWMEEPAPFYAAIDALLMPSRYEGVPLSMLEALASGLPVVASDRDGMRDWLPSDWRFDYLDAAAAGRAMGAARTADPLKIASLKDRVWGSHSIESFQQAFHAALESWL